MTRKKISVSEICTSISERTKILGLENKYISIPSPIDDANKDSISFCSKKRVDDTLRTIRNSKAKVIICSNEFKFTEQDYKNKTLILVKNPRMAFIQIIQKFFKQKVQSSISSTAVIDKGANIHPNVYIGPHSYIGKCEVGEGTIIYGNAHIYSGIKIGKGVIIHAGTVIGADGFSYERNEKGELEEFPHIGGVVIEDNVEIGSNTSIDRGTLDNTIIGKGTKIDNLCHIAHNVVIGKHCVIIAQSMIGGSTKIGDYSWIAPSVCIRDGIKIGKNVLIGMGSVITKDVGDGWVVYGVPGKKVRENAVPPYLKKTQDELK